MSENMINGTDRRTLSRQQGREWDVPDVQACTPANDTGADRAATTTGVDTVTGDASDSPVGQLLGGTYLLGDCLASGGMGEIYAARHLRLPGRFAVKMLQPMLCVDGLLRGRFRQEAEIMATLRHPHVAQVIDYNVTPEGRPFLVMELIEGEDLAKVAAREGTMDPGRAATYIRQIAAALAVAHARGIVHLDLKPENVMVTNPAGDEPFVKVIDFGIAQSPGRERDERTPVMGTPDYMAPEQVNGGVTGLDGRADQFSLAVMAFFLMTGESPWGRHDDPVAMLFRICHETPRSFTDCAVASMPEVEAVLRRALAKRAEDRFATVTEFARAFDAAAAKVDAPVASAVLLAPPVVREDVDAPAAFDSLGQPSSSGPATRALRWRRRSAARMVGFAMVAGLLALLVDAPPSGWRLPIGARPASSALAPANEQAIHDARHDVNDGANPDPGVARGRQRIALLP